MGMEGGCYCGQVRYDAGGDALMKGQCHCRECQHISGGGPNFLMGMPEADFSYTKGEAKGFTRSDLESPVTRDFCPDCGTHLLSRVPGMPGVFFIKVGTLDDPSVFGASQMVIFTVDQQSFHQVPEGVPTFERGPG